MKKRFLLPIVFSLFLLGNNSSFAAHIIGGDITVRRTSANNYEITMTFFRDCDGFGAGFDSPVYIGIYNKSTDAQQQVVNMGAPVVTNMVLGNGCYSPGICMQKGIYTANVFIPNNASGYYLSWLRCCRNAIISNIVTPGDDGSVFYTEICDPAIVNSSPVFSTLPDGFMCRNYLNSDLFTATDADGDVLVYSLSTPLSCSPTGQCDNSFNVTPSTSTGNLPDPYGLCVWKPGFSATNPVGDPATTINSATGEIRCTPPNLGVYVLCVKVEEWRSGTKIGEIRRDFQFDVLNGCTIFNMTANPGNPVCLGTAATLIASGALPGMTYSWNPGGATTPTIIVNPGAPGNYNYTVTATNGSCTSTSSLTLVVNPNVAPTITPSGDPCLGQTMTLTASGAASYSWSNSVATAAMSTTTAGTYTVWGTTGGCTGTNTATISSPVTASTYTWTGAATAGSVADNWFNPLNWSAGSGCIPTCSKDVVIPPAASWVNPGNRPDIGIGNGAAACRNITLHSGALFEFSNVASQLNICGDFVDNGLVLGSSGKGVLNFVGTVPQNFIKTGGGSAFHNVILNNTASTPKLTIKEGNGYKDLVLGGSGVFTFTSGMLITEGSRALEINNPAAGAITGHAGNRYVYGRVRRFVTNNTSYDFPVGRDPSGTTVYPYQRMNITFGAAAISGGLTNLTVCFDNPNNSTGTNVTTQMGLPLSENSGQYTELIDNGGTNTGTGYPGPVAGIWTVIPDAGTATYDMTLYGKNYDNAGSAGNYYSILRRNTFSMCGALPPWTLSGTVFTSSITGNDVVATRKNMVGFSQFVLAEHDTPLPVELMAFDASCVKDGVILTWITASEMNNDHFTIERSEDGNPLSYQPIATIPGAGNSSTIKQYSFTDKDAQNGTNFYRLSQTDIDGSTAVFAPISIDCKENSGFNFIGALPNPAVDQVSVLYTSDNEGIVSLRFTDMLGQEISSQEIVSEVGLNTAKVDLSRLGSGVYFIALNNGSRSFVKKIVKKD